MARPKGIKVSTLTPDNVAALRACQDQGWLPSTVVITATTATWPPTYNAAGALQTILVALGHSQGSIRRALHAVRRKLEKQVRPGATAQVPQPDPPKARKTKNPVACQAAGHGELVDVGPGRAKCLDCGLIVDRITPKTPARGHQTPAQPARAEPEARRASASRKPVYAVVEFPGVSPGWHVVEFKVGRADPGLVIATCADKGTATAIASAMNSSAGTKDG